MMQDVEPCQKLLEKIISWLLVREDLTTINARRAYIERVGIDHALRVKINWCENEGVSDFLWLLFPLLKRYGNLSDGRDPVEAVLEASKLYKNDDDISILSNFIHAWRACKNQQPVGTILDEPNTFIHFANRVPELDRVVHYPEGAYYIFEAPAGYGKTRLLGEIRDRLLVRDWLSVYISLKVYDNFSKVIQHISNELKIETESYDYDRPDLTGIKMGGIIAETCKTRSKQGICLLIDIDNQPLDRLISLLQIIVNEYIPGFFDGLTQNPDSHFRKVEKSFRVVIAGRYMARRMNGFSQRAPKFSLKQLKPFNQDVISEICSTQHAFDNREIIDDFAAHLFFYSGGHPHCIARILDLFTKRHSFGETTPETFFVDCLQEIEILALEEASNVLNSIEVEWRKTFNALCLYPRFDRPLLQRLMDDRVIWEKLAEDGYDLANKLQKSHLIDWTKDSNCRHLSDSITRRLLTIHLRYDVPRGQFEDLCEHASLIYESRIDDTGELRTYWAVEALFLSLQKAVFDIHQGSQKRDTISTTFFDQVLPRILQKLTKGRDKRDEREPFLSALDNHWELQFMLNYFLRREMYNNNPYTRLRTVSMQYFDG
ncbi:MAG: hypothetical protein IPM53_25440 [Anaerolineaceae bacterium]|nr:hypothetical protein [Anaerolineaceae bacterium]